MFKHTDMDDLCVQTSKFERIMWDSFTNEFSDLVEDAYLASNKHCSSNDFHYELNAVSREVFSRMYSSSDKKVVKCDIRYVNEIQDALTQLAEFKEARYVTKGNQLYSGAFVLGFMSSISNSIDFESCDEIVEEEVDGETERNTYRKSIYKPISGVKIRSMLRKAVSDGEEVVELISDMEGFSGGDPSDGNGIGAGQQQSELEKKNNIKKLLNSGHKERLRKISAAIGRLKNVMNAAVTKHAIYAKSEVYGVKLGGEIQNLISSEFTKLAMGGAMQAETLGRIASNNAMQLNFRGKEKEGMGPILVYVDGSGSMDAPFRGTNRSDWATAISVVLCMAANKKKRAFSMKPFNSRVQDAFQLRNGFNTDDLIKSISFNPSGGTRFSPCFTDAKEMLSDKEFKKADIVMVTDGDASDYNFYTNDAKTLKAKGARIHLIKIGNESYRTAIDSISDTITQAVDGNDDNDMEELFSSIMKEN